MTNDKIWSEVRDAVRPSVYLGVMTEVKRKAIAERHHVSEEDVSRLYMEEHARLHPEEVVVDQGVDFALVEVPDAFVTEGPDLTIEETAPGGLLDDYHAAVTERDAYLRERNEARSERDALRVEATELRRQRDDARADLEQVSRHAGVVGDAYLSVTSQAGSSRQAMLTPIKAVALVSEYAELVRGDDDAYALLEGYANGVLAVLAAAGEK